MEVYKLTISIIQFIPYVLLCLMSIPYIFYYVPYMLCLFIGTILQILIIIYRLTILQILIIITVLLLNYFPYPLL